MSKNKKHVTNIKNEFNMFTPFWDILYMFNNNVMYLNNSKYFAGVVMILLNVGSKFISIQFSKSTEQYLKYVVSKQLLVFSMAWMGTRDIYTALGLTAIFTVLSDYILNEDSPLCAVPYKYRVLHKLVDQNSDDQVSEAELNDAVVILEKAKKAARQQKQQEAFSRFDFQKF